MARKKSLGEQLAGARKAYGMSQEELGEAVGAAGRTISTWETDVHLPTRRVLPVIEALYGWPVGTVSYTIRTGAELPPVASAFTPGQQTAIATAAVERARLAQTSAGALELLFERVTALEDRVQNLESRRSAQPKSAR